MHKANCNGEKSAMGGKKGADETLRSIWRKRDLLCCMCGCWEGEGKCG